MQYNCTIENLDCANCANKIERAISAANGYDNVSLSFATKKLRFVTDRPNAVAEVQAICDSIEDGVIITDDNAQSGHTHEHEHGKSERRDKILLAVSAVLGVAALIVHLTLHNDTAFWITLALAAPATLLSGYKTLIRGVKSAFKLRFDESTLMTIAIIAAFALGEFTEGAMVSVLFAIGEMIEDMAVDSSRRDIEKLSQIRPDSATVLKNGQEETVAAAEVAVGSVILVKPHERIPLDGIVRDSQSTVDNAALTGESIPVTVSDGSEVLSGGMNGDRLLKIETTKAFGESTATRIMRLVEDAAAQKGSREKLISRFASVYTPIVIAIAVLLAVIPPLLGLGSWHQWIYRGLAVLVAACPCAIVISVPLAYYAGIGSASRHGVLIKGGKYLEALAKADAFAFDKTGTLTTGKLTVDKTYAEHGYTEAQILQLAAACEQYSSHPIAAAIKANADSIPEVSSHAEIAGCGIKAIYGDKEICCGNERLLNTPIPESMKTANVFVTLDGKLIGAITVSDAPRPEAKSVLQQLRQLGVRSTVMLTGDSKANAERVAKQLEVTDYNAELMPQDKLTAIGELKQTHRSVCFVGDGINDAPVLRASDCGIAMGLGSEAAIEAGDMVLSNGNLEHLPTAVKLARRALNTVKSNITFALAVKAAVIILAALGLSAMWMSVLADTGVCVVCVLYTARLLKK